MNVIRKNQIIICFISMVLWLIGLLLPSSSYKMMELFLLVLYVLCFYYFQKTYSIYGDITIFLFFYFLFLCSYPIFDLFGLVDVKENHLFFGYIFDDESIFNSINMLIITLIGILCSCIAFPESNRGKIKLHVDYIRKMPASFIKIFLLFFCLTMIYRFGQIIQFQSEGGDYLNLFRYGYTHGITKTFSFVPRFFSALFYISLAYGDRNIIWKCIVMYVLSMLPVLFMGQRGELFVSVVFIVWYISNHVKPIKMKYALVSILVLILISHVTHNIRYGREYSIKDPFVYTFFLKRGASFDILPFTNERYDTLVLENRSGVPYFLGRVHDYLVYSFDRITFQNSIFGKGQTSEALKESGYFGWKITYVMSPELYSVGHGVGSTFVAENYMTGKYAGCFFLAIIMMFFVLKLKKKTYSNRTLYNRVYYFIAIQALFFSPRNNFWIVLSEFVSYTAILIILNFIFPNWFRKYRIHNTLE